MRYLIDCDGVLTDFVRHAIKTTGSGLRPEDQSSFDLFDHLEPDLLPRLRMYLTQADWWESMPLIERAQAGVDRLRRIPDVKLFVVTKPYSGWRGSLGCQGWLEARYKLLAKSFDIPAQNVIPTGHKELIRGDVLLDDREEHLVAWKSLNPEGQALLFGQPYNREVTGFKRVSWAHGLVG